MTQQRSLFLPIKSNYFDKDIEMLIRSLTDKSSWETFVESSTLYFSELADKSNQIKLSFVDKAIFLNVYIFFKLKNATYFNRLI